VQWGKDNSLPVSGPLTDYELRKAPIEVILTQAGFGVPYIHTQPMPALNWAINHNLGFRPDVTLLNSGSVEIEGEIVHISDNLAVAIFVVPVAGTARCL
jgi:hypothetical protein